MMKWLPLIAGGMLGTVFRYLISGSVYRFFGAQFPYGTLTVNLLGCFLLGFLAIASETKFFLNPHTQLLLIVGFCGAFTTFSTFILESAQLMHDGKEGSAFLNLTGSLILGFLALRLGVKLGDWLL